MAKAKAKTSPPILAEPKDASRGNARDSGPTDTSSIGGRVQALRREHRYSIRKLADVAGVSASLISDVERGKVEPSISTLKRVADALGTTLTYFFSEPHAQNGRVVRASERTPLTTIASLPGNLRRVLGTGGIVYELASPADTEVIEAIYGRYEVGAS